MKYSSEYNQREYVNLIQVLNFKRFKMCNNEETRFLRKVKQ